MLVIPLIAIASFSILKHTSNNIKIVSTSNIANKITKYKVNFAKDKNATANENSNNKTNVTNNIKFQNRDQSKQQIDLYNFILNIYNQKSVEKRVIRMNNGTLHLGCIYYVSESLRRIGLNIPMNVSNTSSMTSFLKKQAWKISYDAKKLLPGDICFTTKTKKINKPTHAYIFMGWVQSINTKYAYVCDNQSYDFGKSYHKRNITIAVPGKEAFSYFLYKSLQ